MKPKALLTGAALTLAGCTSTVQTTQQRPDGVPADTPDGGAMLPPEQPIDTTGAASDSTSGPEAHTMAEAIALAQAAAAAAAEELTIRPVAVQRLTTKDYSEVARRLKVEPEAVMAVVEIEAGRAHEGFYAPGKPIINFDLSMFRRFCSRHGIDLNSYRGSHPYVFNTPSGYGSVQAARYARYEQAVSIDEQTAVYGTFWGMFQIGGFNWKLCGADSYTHFVELMSRSERDQLELFANLIVACGFDKHLRNKDWTAFARCYNGPGYAGRGYHKRMASAYRKFKKSGDTSLSLPEDSVQIAQNDLAQTL